MFISYFADTDTLLFTFNENHAKNATEVNANTWVESDEEGRIVSMTITHAATIADIQEWTFSQPADPSRGGPVTFRCFGA